MLYGYGISALAFAAGAWLFHRQGARQLAEGLVGGAVLLVFVLVTLKVRRFFHPETLLGTELQLKECATYVNTWLVLGGIALLAARGWLKDVLRNAGYFLAIAAAVTAPLLLCVAFNPLWCAESIGTTPVLNYLLYIYGLPAVLFLPIAGQLRREAQTPLARALGSLALVLVLLLISLEVRQWFHGDFLNRGPTTSAESYAYSAAWVILGTVLLIAGIVTRGLVLRWASLAVMLLAIGKVFLVDTARLQDLYRVFSFLGLGVSLLLLAFLYQRFVFGRKGVAA
jgi:uncharacterized membrane protein